jgi:predicted nucleic acid-binding protein
MPASKRIVVDASVARSAGSGEKENQFSGPSRATLKAIEGHHQVVFSMECFHEWSRHERGFARRWRRRMVARKRVVFLGETVDDELREALAGTVELERDRRAIRKDAHLVEAALQTDRVVISRDEIVRSLFRQCCPKVSQIRNVLWANPENEAEQVAHWLKGGAKEESARRLGAPLG